MAVASALVPHARPDQRTSLALTSPGEKEQKINGKIKVVRVKTERTKKSILSPFRCEECPLLEDEEDISDEEMEQLVIIFRNIYSCFFQILRDYKSHEFEPESLLLVNMDVH